MIRDAAQVGTVAGILTVGMLESMRDGEPMSPFVGGFVASDRQIIRVPMEDEDEVRAWLDQGHPDRVVVGCHPERGELSVVVPHPEQRAELALRYAIQWVRGSGRVFTSQPDRRVREPDLDLVRGFERGFSDVARDFEGWGELGKYGED